MDYEIGNYKNTFDIDLAILGKDISCQGINAILFDLEEEQYILFFFGVVCFDSIANEGFNVIL